MYSLFSSLAAIIGLSDLHQFDPAKKSWRKLFSDYHPSARLQLGFAGIGGQLYVFGGCDVHGERESRCETDTEISSSEI